MPSYRIADWVVFFLYEFKLQFSAVGVLRRECAWSNLHSRRFTHFADPLQQFNKTIRYRPRVWFVNLFKFSRPRLVIVSAFVAAQCQSWCVGEQIQQQPTARRPDVSSVQDVSC